MKVEIDKSFPMPGSAEAAWAVLQDIEQVAACMPGAKITEKLDERRYKGTVSVKFGPANMSFRGEVEVQQLDAAAKTMQLVGKGTDSTGSSAAAMDLTARVEPVDAASCQLVGRSEVSMSGKAASFGGRMAGAVADQVLKQFAANFAARVQVVQASVAAAPPAPPAAEAAAPSTAAATPEAAAAPAPTPAPAAIPVPAAPSAAAPEPAVAPLNGLALVWAMLKDWLAGWFQPKKKA